MLTGIVVELSFLTVNNIMFAIRCLFRRCRDIGYITTGGRLGNGYASPLLCGKEIWEEFLMQGFIAKLDDRRNACVYVND